ncbi:hypothetical protein H257_08375 [Aphanomyces astaci]|uniref:Uncharacterized protein n=1 Tax=Aphanomyces astaci TaxID=112090 RepID=W4GFZ8_APHAT|nr:hypothetical protein H257_08375 [Aphanomyces astaci]ETV78191.1 hypothetical protein H257_08375 [Aphanomyces astaci]|eukprot:XP_009832528.1 hypothetical protein H257_08375 [Aphanomyces astaci]
MPSRHLTADAMSAHCAYKSGKCTYPRAIKLNGELHSLCALHREKQNAHQRKSDRKSRRAKKDMDATTIRVHEAWKIVGEPPDSFLFENTTFEAESTITMYHYRQTTPPSPRVARLPPIRHLLHTLSLPPSNPIKSTTTTAGGCPQGMIMQFCT